MNRREFKPRLAVVSPYLDKSHGTERVTIEWLSHLPDEFEMHVYSQRVEDFDRSKFTLHRIPTLRGPHLFNYIWWFAANHAWRAWDRSFHGLKHDLVFSPGINCFHADVISVQIVFAEFLRQARPELRFSRNPMRSWPRLLHRKLYYALIVSMERSIYSAPRTQLVLEAKKTAVDLERFYPRNERYPVLYLGTDHATFNPARRATLREGARKELGLEKDNFALLLIGNDLLKKGLPVLLEAMSRISKLPLRLLVVSRESGSAYQSELRERGLSDRVLFLPPRADVEFYYAAADLYAGPSLEDTFAMPPGEAMACGLPVIVSGTAGVSEIITDENDGLILKDPRDAEALAGLIRRVYEDAEFRTRLGQKAAQTAQQYTWERNGQELAAIFNAVLQRKKGGASASPHGQT